MINLSYIESLWAQELIGWLVLGLSAVGLYFSLRYVRVSPAMSWIVLAFVGFFGSALATRVFGLASYLSKLPDEIANGLFLLVAIVHTAAWGALVFGLGFLLRDIRERFHWLRDAQERSREEEWLKQDEQYRAGMRNTKQPS